MGDAAVVTAETDVGYEDVAPASGESAAAAQGGAAHTVGDAAVVIAETDDDYEDAAPASGESAAAAQGSAANTEIELSDAVFTDILPAHILMNCGCWKGCVPIN